MAYVEEHRPRTLGGPLDVIEDVNDTEEKVLYAALKITDLNGVEHSLTPENLAGKSLLGLVLGFSASDIIDFTVEDLAGDVRAWLTRGCIIKAYVDFTSPPDSLVFTGMVENIVEEQQSTTIVWVQVKGRDRFRIRLNRKVIEGYQDTETSLIVRDLLEKYYPHEEDMILGATCWEGSGNTISDEGPQELDITKGDQNTWVTYGKYGNAIKCTGAVSYSTVANSSDLDAKSLTVEIWINPYTTLSEYLLGRYGRDGWALRKNADKTISILLRDATGDLDLYTSTNKLSLNNWNHIVAIYDDDLAELKIIINGLEDKWTSIPHGFQNESRELQIGGITWYGVPYYKGLWDELIIYRRALTSQETLDHYRNHVLHQIDETATTHDDVRIPYRPLKEVLDWLATNSGFVYRANPLGAVRWWEAESIHSGILYTENELDVSPIKVTSLLPIMNRIYVLGGQVMQVDQAIGPHTDTGYYTHDYYRAQKFIPTRRELNQISLYIRKVGTPGYALTGSIRADDGAGHPKLTKLAEFTINESFVSTSFSWRPSATEASLEIGETYWIILDKIGSAGNTYEWGTDAAASVTRNESSDDITWTTPANGEHAIKTHFAIPILASAQDYTSYSKFEWREVVHEDKAIVTRAMAQETAAAILEELKDEDPTLRNLWTVHPRIIPDRGKLVKIDLTNLNLDMISYEVQEIRLAWRAGEDSTERMEVVLGRSEEELGEWLAKLKRGLDRAAIGDFGTGQAVNRLESIIGDQIDLSDNLSATQVATGTYQVGTARVGFCDTG